MSQNGNNSDPFDAFAGKFVIQIIFDPVTQRCEAKSNTPNSVIFLGMIETGKQAILQQQKIASPLAMP